VKPELLLSAAALLCLLGAPDAADAAKKKSKQQIEAEAKEAEAEAKRAEAEAKRAEAEAKRAEAEAKKAKAEAASSEEDEPPPAAKKKSKSKKSPKSKAPKLEDESDDVEVEIEDASAEELAEAEASSEVELEETPEKSDEEPEDDDESSSGVPLNWLSFSIQQDALFFGTTPNVCGSTNAMGAFVPGPDDFSCHGPNGVYEGPIYPGVGNEVQGGFGLATFRLMIGYDRLLIQRLLLGGRVGYAFGGEPSVPRGDGFMPFHAELKAQYYFGEAPFSRPSFRPYAAAAVGLAEVDASVNVDYFVDQAGYQAGDKGSFQVWRKAGTGFGALSGGAAYPLGPGQLHAELRLLIMLGNSAIGTALNLGYAYGL
jgi:hypothetical protein